MRGKRAPAALLLAGLWLLGGTEPRAGTGMEGQAPSPTEAAGIRLRVGVDKGRDGLFRYRYLLENLSTHESSWSALYLPFPAEAISATSGPVAAPGLWGDPVFWKAFYPQGYTPLPLWSQAVPPGGSLLAATVESQSPPGLVEVLVDAGDAAEYERRFQEALSRGCVPTAEETERWRREDRRSLWVLGPVPCEPGTYRYWDHVQDTFHRMEALGWFPPETGKSLREALLAARKEASSRDRTAVGRALASLWEPIEALPPGPAAEDVWRFYFFHQDLLRETPCPPGGPVLSLSLPSAQASLGQAVPLRARLWDEATRNPLPGRTVLLEVVEGPRKGRRETAVTDERGEALFPQRGTSEGREEIRVRLQSEGTEPEAACEARAVLAWAHGANLRVYALSPGRFHAQPGGRIRIFECTVNAGDIAAPLSQTHFFLRPAGGNSERILLARRPVPALAPDQFSCLDGAGLVIPAGIPPGEYLLEAEADARGEVVEAEEGDNRFTPYTGPVPEPGMGPLSVPLVKPVAPPGGQPEGEERSRRPSGVTLVRPAAPPPPAGTVAWLEGPLTGSLGHDGPAPLPSVDTGCRETGERPARMVPTKGMEEYGCERGELPEGLLRQVIGKVRVDWEWLGSEMAVQSANHKDFTTWEPVPVPVYEEGPEGFRLKEEVPATRLGPFGFARWNGGASLTFFATARKGEFVETVLHTRTGERGWLRLRETRVYSEEPSIAYTCLAGACAEAEEGSGHPDWTVLNPHRALRLYVAPDPRSPWVPFLDDVPFLGGEELEKRGVESWGLYMGLQRNGFVRVFLWHEETAGGLSGVTVGWLPIRDRDGSLLLWPVGHFC